MYFCSANRKHKNPLLENKIFHTVTNAWCDFNVSVPIITAQLLLCNFILYEFTDAATIAKSKCCKTKQANKMKTESAKHTLIVLAQLSGRRHSLCT